MSEADSLQHVLVGTAGHIDHGKTRLVARLTGVDTDRLPEEKSRGISIDLGFAHWEQGGFEFGVVDVPGHERFVRNMVAGATGINLALLVVAADDGVMPQTREHLEIMDLLGVTTGVVAITKVDLVEAEFVDLVRAEVEDLVQGTFLESCRIVCVSSETGVGLEELRVAATEAAREMNRTDAEVLFRMPIDRVFSLPGHGAIVTGSVLSGEVHPGDALELLPQQQAVRVRSVERHGRPSIDSGARTRTAVNLAGIKAGELHRGQELASPGLLHPAQRMLVEVRLPSNTVPVLKDRTELNLHIGTCETIARIALKGRTLKSGESGFAELRTRNPVVATYGQRFILRRISPAVTVAGGRVLDPCIPAHKRLRDLNLAGKLLSEASEQKRLSFWLSQQDVINESPVDAARQIGLASRQFSNLLDQLKLEGELIEVGPIERRRWLHRDRLVRLGASMMRSIHDELARRQPRRALPRSMLLAVCRGIATDDLLEIVLEHLVKEKLLVKVADQLGPADVQVQLTKKQQQTRDSLLQTITEKHLTPPTIKELCAVVGQPVDQIEPVLHLCVEDGLLVHLGDGLHFTPAAVEEARMRCRDFLSTRREATLSELREAWGVSRKFAVPLGEYFDERGITLRTSDLRRAGPNLDRSLI